MEYGVYLNQYGDERAEFGFTDMINQAERIEDLGYDTIAVGERHFYDDGFYDPITSLSALADRTETIGLMANILILPIYHPLHLAERIANIDVLSDGRTRWGLSLGYRESELVNFGVDMDNRVGRFLESISVMKRLLEGELIDHDGTHFQFENAFIRPEPAQDPRPKFWCGGNADVAIKRAAYRCDGFTAAVTVPEELQNDIELYYDSVEEAGKSREDANVTIMVDGYVGETTKSAREALEPYMLDLHEKYIKWGNPEFQDRPTWEDVEDQVMVGSPEKVADKVRQFEEIGVDHLIFRTHFPGMSDESAMTSVERFQDEVVPRV